MNHREIGDRIGDYRIVGRLGAGASGEVFRAEHVITRRKEAVKLLAHGGPATVDAEKSFLREIEVQASLQHPNIAGVYNAFSTPEGFALVMELVDGEPLSAILSRGGVSLRNGIQYVLQTLQALGYAHDRGVVHRDVKPANIIVAADGSVKLTDFGLAQPAEGANLTPGTTAGSPYYMSPEQVLGVAPADARSDYYSVGIILYEIATGRRPFEGESAFDVMVQQCDSAPVPPVELAPRLGAELNKVILKAIEKDPARRFQSAMEFRTALERQLEGIHAIRKFSPVRRWIAAAALASLAGVVALAEFRHRTPTAQAPSTAQIVPASPAPAPLAVLPPLDMGQPGPTATDKEIGAAASSQPVGSQAEVRKPVAPSRRKDGTQGRLPLERSGAALSVTPTDASSEAPSEKAAELPSPPPIEVPPVSQPFNAGLPAPPQAPPDAPVEPTKRRNVVWRTLNRIIHPAGAKPDTPAKGRQ